MTETGTVYRFPVVRPVNVRIERPCIRSPSLVRRIARTKMFPTLNQRRYRTPGS
jgi:hypothetical protein